MFRFVVEHRLYLTLIDVSQTGNHHGEVLVVDNVDVVLEGELFGFEREPVERDDHSNRQAGHWKQKGEAGKAGQTRRLTTAVAGQATAGLPFPFSNPPCKLWPAVQPRRWYNEHMPKRPTFKTIVSDKKIVFELSLE